MNDKATPSLATQPDHDAPPAKIVQQSLAAWRAELARLRSEERQRSQLLPTETGRLLEIVGQALAQGDGALPADDVARIEEVTRIQVKYRTDDS